MDEQFRHQVIAARKLVRSTANAMIAIEIMLVAGIGITAFFWLA